MSNVIPIREPKRVPGLAVPLFEKLVDFELERSSEHPPHLYYNIEELNASIERELYHILGTQSKAKKEDYLELAEDPINFALPEMFGVPEYTYFEATNKENWKPISRHMSKIIEAFEPRLTNVEVMIVEFDKQKQFLNVSVIATLNIPEFQQQATFTLALKGA